MRVQYMSLLQLNQVLLMKNGPKDCLVVYNGELRGSVFVEPMPRFFRESRTIAENT